MVEVAIAEAFVIAVALAVIAWIVKKSFEERRELEDRLMAICTPIPLTQVQSSRDPSPGTLTYVDEEPYTARGQSNGHAET